MEIILLTMTSVKKSKIKVFSFFLLLIFYLSGPDCNVWASEKTVEVTVYKLIDQSNRQIDEGFYREAVKTALEALALAEKRNRCNELAIANQQVGRILYYNQEPYRNILDYYHRARNYIYNCHLDSMKQQINYNMGVVFVENRLADSAVYYLKQVFTAGNGTMNNAIISRSYAVLADLYLVQQTNLRLARYYVKQAIDLANKSGDADAVSFALIKQGIYYSMTGSFDKSLQSFERVREMFANKGAEDRMYIYRLIAFAKAAKADPEITIAFERFINLRDSVMRIESTRQSAHYQVLYETAKKDREIKLRTAEAENQKNMNKIQLLLFAVVIMLFTFAGVFLFFLQRNKQKQQLLQANILLEQERLKAVIESEEQERKRIAGELHDGLGQVLSTAKMILSGLDIAIESRNSDDREAYRSTLGLIDDAVAEVRLISHNLMPGALIKLGLVAAINDLVRKINTAGNVRAVFVSDSDIVKLTETEDIALFRIVQEIVSNSLKHAGATVMEINLGRQKDEIVLSFTDNGCGFDVAEVVNSRGIGWRNIYSRVAILQGKMTVDSEEGEGTHIKITFNKKV